MIYDKNVLKIMRLLQELTVTDDTVLEGHNEDPTLVQMRLIGDGGMKTLIFLSYSVNNSRSPDKYFKECVPCLTL